MPDSTIAAIDRFFDLVDHGVEHVDRVLNRGKQTVEKHRGRRARRPEVIDTETVATPARGSARAEAPGKTQALTRKPRFYIVEAVAAGGGVIFVVTDGGNARTECATRQFAEQILQALQGAP